MKPENNPYNIVKMFEDEMATYTGSKYAVAVDSCTNALFLCLKWQMKKNEEKDKKENPQIIPDIKEYKITIPRRTYLSVPQSIERTGFKLEFENLDWKGIYQLKPYLIYDAAKRLTSNMYIPGSLMCLSFHIKKHLKIGKGGMILCDDKEIYEWLKKARYEGRSEVPYHEDNIEEMGYNHYMTPVDAARGLMLLQNYPEHVEDLPEKPYYRDLKEFDMFKFVSVKDA